MTPFATTRLYFGRTFPLRLLYSNLQAEFENYVIVIWPCPRVIWIIYFATPIVFSIVDSVFCGYVPLNAKSTALHMIDNDGSRADLEKIIQETRYGEAFYHSASQPQHSVDDDDGDTLSDYQLARARTIISKEVRKLLTMQRGVFCKAVREYISRCLKRTGSMEATLAKW